jgi:hypothetical protein
MLSLRQRFQPSQAETHHEHHDAKVSAKKENEFYVRGNCASCKARIEKAAKDAGADSQNGMQKNRRLLYILMLQNLIR